MTDQLEYFKEGHGDCSVCNFGDSHLVHLEKRIKGVVTTSVQLCRTCLGAAVNAVLREEGRGVREVITLEERQDRY